MKAALLAMPFVLAIALAVYVEGPFNGFVVWNALPVLLGFGVLVAGRHARPPLVAGCMAFAVLATLPVVLFHLAWMFDWGGMFRCGRALSQGSLGYLRGALSEWFARIMLPDKRSTAYPWVSVVAKARLLTSREVATPWRGMDLKPDGASRRRNRK